MVRYRGVWKESHVLLAEAHTGPATEWYEMMADIVEIWVLGEPTFGDEIHWPGKDQGVQKNVAKRHADGCLHMYQLCLACRNPFRSEEILPWPGSPTRHISESHRGLPTAYETSLEL